MKLKLWPWGAVGAALLVFAFGARKAGAATTGGTTRRTSGGTGALAPLSSAFPYAPDGSTVVTPTGVLTPPPPRTKFEAREAKREAERVQKEQERNEREGIITTPGNAPGALPGTQSVGLPIFVGGRQRRSPNRKLAQRGPGGPA